ncbi:MAG: Type 1 glutamine amidotransferase-like domain-containing protein [Acidimicrobiales bacterium]|nr:Type 1 glutamine amidotransferase-like domain-containing protein [Acidimicrobiales bacterium]
MSGLLALVGGREFGDGCTFDRQLLAASGGTEVVLLPTAAAFEHPDRIVAAATAHFAPLGGTVRALQVLGRHDAVDDANVAAVRAARFVYLSGGSPMHLRSVLKDSPVWEALLAAWHEGAVVAAAGEAAGVLCDPLVDPRGGAFTVGLGLVEQLAVIAHHDRWPEDRRKRTLELAPPGVPLVGIDDQTAAIRQLDGTWLAAGVGQVVVYIDGVEVGLDALRD